MRKIISIFSLMLIFILMVSCSIDKNVAELPKVELDNEVSVLVPSGTPYLALCGLLNSEKIKVDISNGPSVLQSALPSGSYDIIVAPINLAVNLYNKGNSSYQVSHILTANNTFVVTKSENKLDSIMDLKDEKVLAFASNGIPANILKKVYNDNQLDISNVDFSQASSAAVYSLFAGDSTDAKYVLMSEPEISKLIINDKMSINMLHLSKVLDANIAQACLYVNPNSKNVDDINKVLNLIGELVEYLNLYPKAYADAVLQLDESRTLIAMGKDVIVNSIPQTSIIFKEAKTNKSDIENTLNMLGVDLPNDSFYR